MDIIIWSYVSGILGILGFLISFIIFINQRPKLIVILTNAFLSKKEKYVFCQLIIINASTLPISISDFTINDKTNRPIHCLFHKQFVGEFFKLGKTRIEVTETIFSDIPPIQISPHGSFGGIIAFPYLKDKFPLPKDDTNNRSNYWLIKITTSRKVFKKKLTPPLSDNFIPKKIPNPFYEYN